MYTVRRLGGSEHITLIDGNIEKAKKWARSFPTTRTLRFVVKEGGVESKELTRGGLFQFLINKSDTVTDWKINSVY